MNNALRAIAYWLTIPLVIVMPCIPFLKPLYNEHMINHNILYVVFALGAIALFMSLFAIFPIMFL